jgi:hypothetical protein
MLKIGPYYFKCDSIDPKSLVAFMKNSKIYERDWTNSTKVNGQHIFKERSGQDVDIQIEGFDEELLPPDSLQEMVSKANGKE